MNMIFFKLDGFIIVFHISLLTECIMAIFNKIFCLLEMYLDQELLIFKFYNTHRSEPVDYSVLSITLCHYLFLEVRTLVNFDP
jgi:hypothetical protein